MPFRGSRTSIELHVSDQYASASQATAAQGTAGFGKGSLKYSLGRKNLLQIAKIIADVENSRDDVRLEPYWVIQVIVMITRTLSRIEYDRNQDGMKRRCKCLANAHAIF